MFTVLDDDCHDPLLILYWPELPEIEIGEAALIPLTVIEFDSMDEFLAASVWSVNVNWSGVVSGGSASMLATRFTPS